MPLNLYRQSGPKFGELDWRERVKVQTLLTRAERDPAAAQTVLQVATGWLERRVVNKLTAELLAGTEHLRELQFRHAAWPTITSTPQQLSPHWRGLRQCSRAG